MNLYLFKKFKNVMTQENKEPLLLRYLCAILPYKVIVSCAEGTVMGIHWNKVKLDASLLFELQENGALSYVKPYLRSMDSMNEEEVIEFNNITLWQINWGFFSVFHSYRFKIVTNFNNFLIT